MVYLLSLLVFCLMQFSLEERRRIILKLFADGVPPMAIAKQTGIGKSSVYRALKFFGIGLTEITKVTPEMEQFIIELYQSGVGCIKICDKLKIPRTRKNLVYRVLERNNVACRGKIISPFLGLVDEIISLYNEGYSSTVIAEMLDISRSTAKKFIRQNCQVRSRIFPAVRNRKERDRLFLEEMDCFNAVAYLEWRSSDKRIPLDDFKQSAYCSALRAAEIWEGRASYRTYACKCIRYGFLALYRQHKKIGRLGTWEEDGI